MAQARRIRLRAGSEGPQADGAAAVDGCRRCTGSLAAIYGILLLIKLRTLAPGEINHPQVFADAARTTFNIAGQILMSLAFYEQWYLWILGNIASILLWGSTMTASTASSYTVVMFIKYCFYLVNSLNGLRIWFKLSRE